MEKNPPQQFTKKDQPNPSEKMPKQKEKKALWPLIILGVMMLVFVGIAALLYLRPSNTINDMQQSGQEIVEETSVPQRDTTNVQTTLVTWINEQNTDGASFITQQTCTTSTDCEPGSSEQSVLAVWALSKKASDQGAPPALMSQTTEMQNSITTVSSPWSCHFLYNTATSTEFEFNTEDRLSNLCLEKGSQVAGDITQQELTLKMQSIIDQARDDNAQIFQTEPVEVEFNSLLEQASTDAINVSWSQASVSPALESFSQALDMYTSEQEDISLLAPRLGIAALDMYRATEEDIYLDFAEYVYQLHFSPTCITLTNCVDFLYFANQLHITTEGEQYAQGQAVLTENILLSYFDAQNYAQIYDIGALYQSNDSGTVYPIRENALVLGTFAQN